MPRNFSFIRRRNLGKNASKNRLAINLSEYRESKASRKVVGHSELDKNKNNKC